MTTAAAPDTAAIKSWLLDLQSRIVTTLEALDGLPFRTDAWDRSPTPPLSAQSGGSPQMGEHPDGHKGGKAEAAFNGGGGISRLIEEEATVGDIRTLMALRKGNMAIVEIELPVDRCVVCNKQVHELKLPVDCLIVALVRGEETIPVHGDTEMQPGDVVIAFTNVTHERALKKALTGA